ncbi:MAG TPA: hypothetical protein PLF78_01080 [Caulobacter sp.]|nr:hypothetical protein [Caulobacter sp.]
MAGAFWTSDFYFEGGRVKVRTTGADLAFDRALVEEALVWFAYYVPVRATAAWNRLTRPGPSVWFAPYKPRPWYLVWAAAAWSGARIAASPEKADAAMYFEDSALGSPPNAGPEPRFNFHCTDVTKTHVARMFEQTFGYPLAVDPESASGPVVEKGEDNGVHDGRIVQAPCPALPGKTYQRLIDNTSTLLGEDYVDDLRTPCVGGKPVLVFIKRRHKTDRFANHNSSVTLTTAESVFSPEEIEAIGRFCAAMNLDWGGLDILRDRASGRLYIVDVNKTDMGPPIALPLPAKLTATRLLADAFRTLISAGVAGGRA